MSDLKQAQKQASLADKIDNALIDLSRALSAVAIGDDFPRSLSQDHVDQIRSSAIFLTASVMDCLYVIIKCVERNGLYLLFPSDPL
jgi:hypothetical protein